MANTKSARSPAREKRSNSAKKMWPRLSWEEGSWALLLCWESGLGSNPAGNDTQAGHSRGP